MIMIAMRLNETYVHIYNTNTVHTHLQATVATGSTD